MKVLLYADGSALKNPGPAGYGTVLICDGKRKEFSAGYRLSTNNRMEIMGVLSGVQTMSVPCELTIISDSQYVIFALSKGWINKWKRKGWKTQKNDPVLNRDLWEALDTLLLAHKVTFRWVRGHGNDNSIDTIENNRCHELAETAAKKAKIEPDGTDYEYEKVSKQPPMRSDNQLIFWENNVLTRSEIEAIKKSRKLLVTRLGN